MPELPSAFAPTHTSMSLPPVTWSPFGGGRRLGPPGRDEGVRPSRHHAPAPQTATVLAYPASTRTTAPPPRSRLRAFTPPRLQYDAGSHEEGEMAPRTLFEKVWDDHVIRQASGEPALLYVDLHLVHEVTSPQAFDGLRLSGRSVRRPDLTVSTIDHGIPTANRQLGIRDPLSKRQIDTLISNCEESGITLYGLDDPRQGIVHVIGPEQGLTQPGMTIVCGDSHTATHGAFGALAFGIGTSEVEHVLATQTLPQAKPKSMAVTVNGELGQGVTSKDLILAIIAKIGVDGGIGHVIEYRGPAIESLSMEARMTICNMSIEAGARAGLIAPDDHTFEYLEGRPQAPSGDTWDGAVAYWRTLATDDGATFDSEVFIDASTLAPHVSWGTNPAQTVPVTARVPGPLDYESALGS